MTLACKERIQGVLATLRGDTNPILTAPWATLSKIDLRAFKKWFIAGVMGTEMFFWLSSIWVFIILLMFDFLGFWFAMGLITCPTVTLFLLKFRMLVYWMSRIFWIAWFEGFVMFAYVSRLSIRSMSLRGLFDPSSLLVLDCLVFESSCMLVILK